MSLELRESSMFGGTSKANKVDGMNILKDLISEVVACVRNLNFRAAFASGVFTFFKSAKSR
jgi:hypothetical protein